MSKDVRVKLCAGDRVKMMHQMLTSYFYDSKILSIQQLSSSGVKKVVLQNGDAIESTDTWRRFWKINKDGTKLSGEMALKDFDLVVGSVDVSVLLFYTSTYLVLNV